MQLRYRRPRKICMFCKDKSAYIDYKDVALLSRFLNEKAKILPKRATGNCARHQRELAAAVKRSRMMALIPFVKS